jgi:hypothetical protein
VIFYVGYGTAEAVPLQSSFGKVGLEVRSEVQFTLNGKSYMLNFNPEDERWYLVTAGLGGMAKAIPVFEDEEGFVPNVVAPAESAMIN